MSQCDGSTLKSLLLITYFSRKNRTQGNQLNVGAGDL